MTASTQRQKWLYATSVLYNSAVIMLMCAGSDGSPMGEKGEGSGGKKSHMSCSIHPPEQYCVPDCTSPLGVLHVMCAVMVFSVFLVNKHPYPVCSACDGLQPYCPSLECTGDT